MVKYQALGVAGYWARSEVGNPWKPFVFVAGQWVEEGLSGKPYLQSQIFQNLVAKTKVIGK